MQQDPDEHPTTDRDVSGHTDDTDVDQERLLAIIHAQAADRLVQYAATRKRIRAELSKHWRAAFDSYDLLLIHIGDALDLIEREIYPTALQHEAWVVGALRALTARASRTAKEVRVLLSAGYPAGAAARYRTMHELYVTACVIAHHGDDLAERYLKFSGVANYRKVTAARAYFAQSGQNVSPEWASVIADVEAEYQQLQARYSNDPAYFARGEYQWAASTVGRGKRKTGESPLRFTDLEDDIHLTDRRLMYRMVSEDVHSGASGAVTGFTARGEAILAAGPVDDGIAVRAVSAVIDLSGICVLYLTKAKELVNQQGSTEHQLKLLIAALPALATEAMNIFQRIDAR